MKLVEIIVLLITIGVGALIVFASGYGLAVMWRGRDKVYREKYEEFIRQKERVESRLEKSRQSQKG